MMGYSYLKDSMGFWLAALRAGYQPKKIPVTVEQINESTIALMDIMMGHFIIPETMPDTPGPAPTLIIPPMKLRKIASIKN